MRFAIWVINEILGVPDRQTGRLNAKMWKEITELVYDCRGRIWRPRCSCWALGQTSTRRRWILADWPRIWTWRSDTPTSSSVPGAATPLMKTDMKNWSVGIILLLSSCLLVFTDETLQVICPSWRWTPLLWFSWAWWVSSSQIRSNKSPLPVVSSVIKENSLFYFKGLQFAPTYNKSHFYLHMNLKS